MGSPDTVDHYPGSQWVVGRRQGPGKFKTPTPVGLESRLRATCENRRHGPWGNMRLLGGISLEVDLDVAWFVVTQGMRHRNGDRASLFLQRSMSGL